MKMMMLRKLTQSKDDRLETVDTIFSTREEWDGPIDNASQMV